MMPQIEAGERLAAIGDAAMAAGNLDRGDARRLARRLEDAAGGRSRKVEKVTPAVLAGMGIGVASSASKRALSDG